MKAQQQQSASAKRGRMATLVAGCTCALLATLVCAGPSLAVVSDAKPTQYDVEAAYLFNFSKFVTWPGSANSNGSFLICVLGEDPFGPVLDKTIAGEQLHGAPVEDKRIERPQDAAGCSIVYISSSESSRLSKILPLLKDAPVLTVSDMPGFAQHGGMIQFVLRDGRVRFVVNLGLAQSDGLVMSSELLKVAVEVITPKGNR